MTDMARAVNLRRRIKWKGGLIPIVTLGVLVLSLLYLMPRTRFRPALPISSERPTVVLRQAKIIGVEVEAGIPQIIEAFRGVPYAQSTAGERRFLPPLPVNASEAKFDASIFRDQCPTSEDCLNANIYRPKERGSNPLKKLPVVILFHGGAFNFGASDSSRYLLSFVAWSSEPIIGVAFNYRIGAFGFLASKVMQDAGLLNVGLKDQVLLMEWVKENIAAFGGDPDNVTLMGSSAGAHSIGHHLLHTPKEPPLFHRAILESGAPTARAVYSASNPVHERQFQDFLQKLKLGSVPEKDLITALRKVSTADFRKASEAIYAKYNPSVQWPFQPVIDGHGGMIPIAPIKALKAGKFHKVPLLLGFNTNEGAIFVPKTANTNQEFKKFFENLLPSLNSLDIEKLADIYPDPTTNPNTSYNETRSGLGKQFRRLDQAYGHFAYVAPVRQTAHLFATADGDGVFGIGGDPAVYLYHFAALSSALGAEHGSQGPWSNYMPERRDKGKVVDEIAGCMHAYWSSFVASGDPNGVPGRWGGRMEWPRYEGEGEKGKVLVLGEGNEELVTGGDEGVAVQVKDDEFANFESRFWRDRTELFEF